LLTGLRKQFYKLRILQRVAVCKHDNLILIARLRPSSSSRKKLDDEICKFNYITLDGKEAYNTIKALIKENCELKNQIKLYKQSSERVLMTPQKLIESMNTNPVIHSPGLLSKKKPKKLKKKMKRRKKEYLNP